MKKTSNQLHHLNKDELIALLQQRDSRIDVLEERLRLATAALYGKRSEKRDTEHPYQSDLFNEAEATIAEDEQDQAHVDREQASDETITVPEHTRKKTAGRAKLSEDLRREVIEHDLSDDDKICSCGCGLKRIGQDISENLEFVPAQLYVEQHVRLKYGCPACEETVRLATKPPQLLAKTNAGAGVLAFVVNSKYQDSLPLHRQNKILARHGAEIPRNTLARWITMTSDAVQPIIDVFERHSQTAPVILMDETTVQVNKEPGKAANSKSYMWVRRALVPPDNPDSHAKDITLYHYNPSRSGQVPLATKTSP